MAGASADRGRAARRGRCAARWHLRLRARAGRGAGAPPVRFLAPVRRHRQPAGLARDAGAGRVAASRRDRPPARGVARGRRGAWPLDRLADARHGRRPGAEARRRGRDRARRRRARAVGRARAASRPRAARRSRLRGRAARHDDVADRGPPALLLTHRRLPARGFIADLALYFIATAALGLAVLGAEGQLSSDAGRAFLGGFRASSSRTRSARASASASPPRPSGGSRSASRSWQEWSRPSPPETTSGGSASSAEARRRPQRELAHRVAAGVAGVVDDEELGFRPGLCSSQAGPTGEPRSRRPWRSTAGMPASSPACASSSPSSSHAPCEK